MSLTIPYQGQPPSRAHPGDAGGDLTATTTITLHVGKHAVIPTGCRLAIPEGHVGLVCPRSGLAALHGVSVLNSPGVIDSGYRGEIGVILINLGDKPVTINEGDRIAQLVIAPHSTPSYTQAPLDTTQRGAGGYGSTGK